MNEPTKLAKPDQPMRTSTGRQHLKRSFPLGLLLALSSVLCTTTGAETPQAPATGILYFVDSGGDQPDLFLGDNQCKTSLGTCTLRAAIQETNARATGQDGIEVDVPTVTLDQALPDITSGISISGFPPGQVTVQRSPANGTPAFRIFSATVHSPGIMLVSGLTITNGLLTDGVAEGAGIASSGTGTFIITSCSITSNNHTYFFGEGAGIAGDYFDVSDSTISGNAGFDSARVGNSTFTNCSINDNTGEGIQTYDGELTVTNCSISNNTGFGINAGGSATVTNSIITGNMDGGVGAFGSANLMNLTNCTISWNTGTTHAGGGLLNIFATVNLTNCTVSGNTAQDGAGISNGHRGGGLSDVGGITNITNCTISGDFTSDTLGLGGGIFNSRFGDVNVSNSTISDNFAINAGSGIWNEQLASEGFGFDVKSSIIADSVAGEFQSQGYNLVRNVDGSSGFTASTDQTGTGASPLDPRLDPNGLQDNGGPTLTIALLSDSSAIDKGTSVGLMGSLTTDQRGDGFPRTIDDPAIANAVGGDGSDSGAFEAAIPIPVAPVAKVAGKVTASSFNARWNSVTGASGYRLDVSTTRSFTTYLIGYQDLDVGNVTSQSVTGLSASTKYFYRVRAYTSSGTSPNSNVIKVTTKAQ